MDSRDGANRATITSSDPTPSRTVSSTTPTSTAAGSMRRKTTRGMHSSSIAPFPFVKDGRFKRFLSILDLPDGETPHARDRSLTWLTRLINEIYDARYQYDTSDVRKEVFSHHSLSIREIPAFVHHFLHKKFGLPVLVEKACLDLVYNLDKYQETNLEASVFAMFLNDEFDSVDLLFFLSVRSIVLEELADKSRRNIIQPDSAASSFIPAKICYSLAKVIFGEENAKPFLSFLRSLGKIFEGRSLENRSIQVIEFLRLAVLEYSASRQDRRQEKAMRAEEHRNHHHHSKDDPKYNSDTQHTISALDGLRQNLSKLNRAHDAVNIGILEQSMQGLMQTLARLESLPENETIAAATLKPRPSRTKSSVVRLSESKPSASKPPVPKWRNANTTTRSRSASAPEPPRKLFVSNPPSTSVPRHLSSPWTTTRNAESTSPESLPSYRPYAVGGLKQRKQGGTIGLSSVLLNSSESPLLLSRGASRGSITIRSPLVRSHPLFAPMKTPPEEVEEDWGDLAVEKPGTAALVMTNESTTKPAHIEEENDDDDFWDDIQDAHITPEKPLISLSHKPQLEKEQKVEVEVEVEEEEGWDDIDLDGLAGANDQHLKAGPSSLISQRKTLTDGPRKPALITSLMAPTAKVVGNMVFNAETLTWTRTTGNDDEDESVRALDAIATTPHEENGVSRPQDFDAFVLKEDLRQQFFTCARGHSHTIGGWIKGTREPGPSSQECEDLRKWSIAFVVHRMQTTRL